MNDICVHHDEMISSVLISRYLVLSVGRCSFYFFRDKIIIYHDFHHIGDWYWDFYGHSLLFELHFRPFVTADAQLPVCFRPWTFSLNCGLNMLPSDAFMSCLHSLLGYSRLWVPDFATDFPDWQVVHPRHQTPRMNHLLPVCLLTFWKSSLKR